MFVALACTRDRLALLAGALLAIVMPARAQQRSGPDRWADSARAVIAAATQRGDVAQLRGAVTMLDRALTAFPGAPLLLHYRGYALYREGTQLAALGKKDGAKRAFEDADSTLTRSAATLAMPETFALRSSVLGQEIALSSNPLAGMRLGPESSTQMGRALDLGPKNPRVWLLRGIGAIYTPKTFGGGTDKAREYLTKALALFADDHPRPPLPAWGHGECYIFLGQVYEKEHQPDSARVAYQHALRLEPANTWVRQVLLPGLDGHGN